MDTTLIPIPQPPQVCFDGLLQFRGLGELSVQFCDEARHLFLEGVAVVFDFLRADVAAGREDVTVCRDFGGGSGFAEAGDVFVFTSPFTSTPCMISRRDFLKINVGELAVDAIDEGAELRASMKRVCLRRSRKPRLVSTFLLFVRNQRQTGICVL